MTETIVASTGHEHRDPVPLTSSSSSWELRHWLGLDAAVTGANGVGYVVLADPLTDLLGSTRSTLTAVGLSLLAFACALAFASRRPRPTRRVVASIVGINVAWTIASITVGVANPIDLTAAGRSWVVAQAVVVGALATMQQRSMENRSDRPWLEQHDTRSR